MRPLGSYREEWKRSAPPCESANPQTISEASARSSAALALRQMGEWRVQQRAYPQAIELYRNSSLLEDSPDTRRRSSGCRGARKARRCAGADGCRTAWIPPRAPHVRS